MGRHGQEVLEKDVTPLGTVSHTGRSLGRAPFFYAGALGTYPQVSPNLNRRHLNQANAPVVGVISSRRFCPRRNLQNVAPSRCPEKHASPGVPRCMSWDVLQRRSAHSNSAARSSSSSRQAGLPDPARHRAVPATAIPASYGPAARSDRSASALRQCPSLRTRHR